MQYNKEYLFLTKRFLEVFLVKKFLSLLLVLIMCLALVAGCGSKEAAEEPAKEEAAATTETVEPSPIAFLTMSGTTEEQLTERYNTQILENYGGNEEVAAPYLIKAVFYDDLNTMMLALNNGKVKWMNLLDKSVGNYILGSNTEPYQIIDMIGTDGAFAMAVPEENTELLATLNAAIEALDAEGTLAQLQADYIENCKPDNMPEPAELPVIEGAETVSIVVTGDLPPMDYVTADGKAAGFNIALLSAISEKANINFEILSANAGSKAMMVSTGKAQAMFWALGRDMGNNTYNFHEDLPDGLVATTPYYKSHSCVLTKEK